MNASKTPVQQTAFGPVSETTLPAGGQVSDVAHYPANIGDTLYATRFEEGATFLDATIGAFKFATLENSTFNCGCDISYIASSGSTNRVYYYCDGCVAYLDATTGPYLGGSARTTGGGEGSSICDVVVDEADSRVFASVCVGPAIPAPDAVTPHYVYPNYEDSVLQDSIGIRTGRLALTADSRFFALAEDRPLRVCDPDTGLLQDQVNLRRPSDIDLDEIRAPQSLLTRIDRDLPAYDGPGPLLAERIVPTRDTPSAFAIVPKPRRCCTESKIR